jgi:hypothetical protein
MGKQTVDMGGGSSSESWPTVSDTAPAVLKLRILPQTEEERGTAEEQKVGEEE